MRKYSLLFLLLLSAAVSLAVAVASANGQQPATDDQKAIRDTIASYVAAFNKGDAAALAAHWADDATYLNPVTGDRVVGRKAIEAEFQKIFSQKGGRTELEVNVESVQFVTPDVAVEEGTANVLRAGEPPEDSTYTVIHVKKDNKWLINLVRETDLPKPEPPSPHDNLRELEWMIGEWVDQDEQINALTSCRWTRNGSFLSRSFNINAGDEVFDGTEVIGWDPTSQNIRGWVFDSDGGFAHEIWSRQGDTWTVTAHAVLPDGRTGTSVRVITKIDDNKFTSKTVSREIDGELLPNIGPVTAVRKSNN